MRLIHALASPPMALLAGAAQALSMADPNGDLEVEFDTIGGLIAHEMGHVPKRGERFSLGGLDFHVLHTKGGAVRWFKVSPTPPDAD